MRGMHELSVVVAALVVIFHAKIGCVESAITIDDICLNGGSLSLTDSSVSCLCRPPFYGNRCQDPFKDCHDVKANGNFVKPIPSGVYNVSLGNQPGQVYCEMRPDADWTVIQRRVSGDVNFHRNWADYEKGFGDMNSNYWIGNSNLNVLTSVSKQILRVEITDWDDKIAYAEYNYFWIGTSAEKYALKSIGSYSGTAGDLLIYNLGMKFTTFDQDNDKWGDNCAVTYKGGFWFNGCHNGNLNGDYKQNGVVDNTGITWYHWKSNYYSYKRSLMMIRTAT